MKRQLDVAAQSATPFEWECPVEDAASTPSEQAELLDDALRRVSEGETPDGVSPEHLAVRPLLDLALAVHAVAPRAPDPIARAAARQRLERLATARRRPRRLSLMLRSAQLAAAVLAITLIVTGTFRIADASLPDSPVYPLKMATEEVQLRLAGDEAANEQLRFAFAQRRLSEWEALQRRTGDADQLSTATERAIDATDRLAQSAQAEMWPRVASLAERQQATLQQEQARVPEKDADSVAKALVVSRRGQLRAGEAMAALKDKAAGSPNEASGDTAAPRETHGTSSRGGARPAVDPLRSLPGRGRRDNVPGVGATVSPGNERVLSQWANGQDVVGQDVKAKTRSGADQPVGTTDVAGVEDDRASAARARDLSRQDVSSAARRALARDRDPATSAAASPTYVPSPKNEPAQSGRQMPGEAAAKRAQPAVSSSTVPERPQAGGRTAAQPAPAERTLAQRAADRIIEAAAKSAANENRAKSEGRQDLAGRGASRR